MCGIIAVVRRRSPRPAPDPAEVLALLDGLSARLTGGASVDSLEVVLGQLAARLEGADRLLRGVPGTSALLAAPDLAAATDHAIAELAVHLAEVEQVLDGEAGAALGPDALELTNAALIRVKD